MKPFNLEQAKKGAPLITRDGREAELKETKHNSYGEIIIAYIYEDNGAINILEYFEKGNYFANRESFADLFIAE